VDLTDLDLSFCLKAVVQYTLSSFVAIPHPLANRTINPPPPTFGPFTHPPSTYIYVQPHRITPSVSTDKELIILLSAEQLPPATEIPEMIPTEHHPPTICLSPARRRLDTRLAIHDAIQAIRCAITHTARASVGLNNAPATFVSGELRLGAVAAKAAQKKLRKALDLLREPNILHPGIRPGCRELPRYPKPNSEKKALERPSGMSHPPLQVRTPSMDIHSQLYGSING
jgi:hypothetical protein